MDQITVTDLEHRIFRIVTSTRVQSDIPGAILAEIGRTHVLLDRSLVKLAYDAKRHFGKGYERGVVASQLAEYWPGDFEPIRQNAAESDTSEIT